MVRSMSWGAFRAISSWIGCLLLAGCNPSAIKKPVVAKIDTQPPWFIDVTKEVGLDFIHDPGPSDGTYFFPQSVGSGVALFDFDNDGRLDIYLMHNAGPKSTSKNKLYHQQSNGTFKDVSSGSGLDVAGFGMGVAAADVNNDGLVDLFITEYGASRLFINQGNGKFKEMTPADSGIDNPLWGTSASFVDYDRDGWLDLVVVNYVELAQTQPCGTTGDGGHRDFCGPNLFKGAVTRLYRNRGCDKNGQWLGFEDRTVASGLGKAPGPGLGVVCADFNGDAWPDLFIANDGKANHLWINQKNGTFKEEALRRGIAFNTRGEGQANMGIGFGDVDGDGLPDLFITHLASEDHGLWRQGPPGMFHEQALAAGLTTGLWRATGFGTVMADFNHDGALDIAIVNGGVSRMGAPTTPFWNAYAQRNQLFVNDGTGKFRDRSADNPAFCGKPNVGRGLAVGDLNGDGALDLVLTEIGGPARVLRNVVPERGHWLMVRAVDPALKRDAIGAEIRVQAGARRWQRWIQPGYSYLCSNDPRAHFGLGTADKIEPIEVLWPDGSLERFPCPSVDRVVEVQRGKGQPVQSK